MPGLTLDLVCWLLQQAEREKTLITATNKTDKNVFLLIFARIYFFSAKLINILSKLYYCGENFY